MSKEKKREEVEKLDQLLRDAMIDALEKQRYDILTDLSPVINYVKANEVTLEKEKGSAEKTVAERTREANKRREQKEKERVEASKREN